MTLSLHKKLVLALLESLASGDPGPSRVIDPDQYIQHNLAASDGVAGFRALLELPPGTVKVRTARVFEDGEYVFAHTEYDFFGPKIGFDVFRFSNDRIVEHWDNLQPTPPQPNPSGRTLIDGPVEAQDLDRTEENKALARSFVENVLMKGRLDRAAHYVAGASYRQHHPMIGDGLDALVGALRGLEQAGTPVRYTRIHRVLGEGSFVLVMSEVADGENSTAFYDLFRVEAGRLAEHWDTVEAVPPRAEWRNANGKF